MLPPSGKGGVASVMKTEHSFDLPRRLQIEFSRTIRHITEDSGTEISGRVMWDTFQLEYLAVEPPIALIRGEDLVDQILEGALDVGADLDRALRPFAPGQAGEHAIVVTAETDARAAGPREDLGADPPFDHEHLAVGARDDDLVVVVTLGDRRRRLGVWRRSGIARFVQRCGRGSRRRTGRRSAARAGTRDRMPSAA